MTDSDSQKIIKLETQMEDIKSKVDTGFADNKDTNKRIEDKLDKFIEAAETKFAHRWVEDSFKWGVGLVVSSVILALLALVIKK